jgi:hypothetical protein
VAQYFSNAERTANFKHCNQLVSGMKRKSSHSHMTENQENLSPAELPYKKKKRFKKVLLTQRKQYKKELFVISNGENMMKCE